MPVPNENSNDAQLKLDKGQKSAFIRHITKIFGKVTSDIEKANNHKKLAEAVAEYLEDSLYAFAPYLKGESASETTGFRKIAKNKSKEPGEEDLNKAIGHYNEAGLDPAIEASGDPIYCPSRRMWVSSPDGCPDIWGE